MSIQVTGIIEGPLGTPSPGITIRVVSKISYRNTYKLSTEDHITTTGGAYDFQLNEGFHKISIRYRNATSFIKLGDVSVSDSTPSPITLTSLLETSSPKALIVQLQGLTDEADVSAQNAAESETNAAISETNAANSAAAASNSESNATGSAAAALLSEQNAATSESNAAQSATNAEQSYQNALAVVPELQADIADLFDGQQSGVIVFQTYALLDAYAPANSTEEKGSFKVTQDPDSLLNGYYSWVSGTTYTKDADLVVNEIDTSNTSDAVSGAAVAEFVGRRVFSYPFTENTVYPVGQGSELSAAIVDVLTDSSVFSEFFVSRVRRNEGGLWEVQVRPTASPDGANYGRFYTLSNPETGGDVVDVHEFNDGDISGIVAINWSKLENAFSTGLNTNPSIMALDKSITSLFIDRYIGYKFPTPIDNRENTFSAFSSEIALDRDRVFSFHDGVGSVTVNFTGAAIPGKAATLEFASTITDVSFNMTPRLISGSFDATLAPGLSNFIFLLYVGDNKYDVIYKQGASTQSKEMPAIPKDIVLSQDRKEITIYFTKNLDETSTVSVNDFILGVKSGSSIQITGNKVIITMSEALLSEPNMAIQYKNNGNLSDIDGYTINGFVNRIYINPVYETFLVDPIDAGVPYNWITYGPVNSHSSDGNVLMFDANTGGGIRSTGMLGLINSGDIIEVKYRCTSGNDSLLWYDENQQFTEFSDIEIIQNEWVISRRVYKPINDIAPNLILASPVNNGVFEIDYIRMVKLC